MALEAATPGAAGHPDGRSAATARSLASGHPAHGTTTGWMDQDGPGPDGTGSSGIAGAAGPDRGAVSYLMVIAGGLYAEVFVRGSLLVPGDAAATARAIAANETLWRSGVAVHLLYLVPAIVTNVLICDLFKAVEPTLARLALVFSLVGVMDRGGEPPPPLRAAGDDRGERRAHRAG